MRFFIAVTLIACAVALAGFATAETLQESRWNAATLAPVRAFEAGRIADRIVVNRTRYEAVAIDTGIPWHAIAGLHNMESGGSFTHHLHEGSPLCGRTRFVPKGRPVSGKPPFTWEVSAADALRFDRLECVRWSSLNSALYACERYNGTGYLRNHPETPTPYLWAGTSVERPGKYVADGKWSSTARSSQIGIAALWKILKSRKLITP